MNKKISLETLKILLTPKEMKNITGGSAFWCECYTNVGSWTCYNPAPGSDCGISEYCDGDGGSCY